VHWIPCHNNCGQYVSSASPDGVMQAPWNFMHAWVCIHSTRQWCINNWCATHLNENETHIQHQLSSSSAPLPQDMSAGYAAPDSTYVLQHLHVSADGGTDLVAACEAWTRNDEWLENLHNSQIIHVNHQHCTPHLKCSIQRTGTNSTVLFQDNSVNQQQKQILSFTTSRQWQ